MRERSHHLNFRDWVRRTILAALIVATIPTVVESVKVESNPFNSYPGIVLIPSFLERLHLKAEGLRFNAWGIYELSSTSCIDTINPINGKSFTGNGNVRLETPLFQLSNNNLILGQSKDFTGCYPEWGIGSVQIISMSEGR